MTIHAGAATLESLRRDVFNDRVWPDFIGMSEKGIPFVKLETLEPGRPVEAAGLRLTPMAVDHVVPTLGFLVEAPGVTVAIPSDTGPTDSFWRRPAQSPHLEGRVPGGVLSRRDVRAGRGLQAPDARDVRGRGRKAAADRCHSSPCISSRDSTTRSSPSSTRSACPTCESAGRERLTSSEPWPPEVGPVTAAPCFGRTYRAGF